MKGKLIEVLGGWLEVREKVDPEADPLALVPGRRGRLETGGPVYEVNRVSPCAVYLHKVFDPPVLRTFEGPDGEERRIKVSNGPVEPGFALGCRFVERVI